MVSLHSSVHFLMTRPRRPLLLALLLSGLIHLLPFLKRPDTAAPPGPLPNAMQATLQPAAPAASVAPSELKVDETPVGPAGKAVPDIEKPRSSAVDRRKPAKTWQQSIGQQLASQRRQGNCYPEDALRQGVQGEVLMRVILDENGKVVASRVEASSGQPALDAAARCAIDRLSALPADAPREFLLPVRFLLR